MKLVLFQTAPGAEISPGVLTGRGIVDISPAVKKSYTPQLTMQGIIDGFERLRPALEKLASESEAVPLDRVRLRPPLPRPGKILACIANYWEHAQRDARPLNMFMKNPDAVVGPGDTIMLPEFTVPWIFMHEAELALVIKGPAKMVKAKDWRSAVFGYTAMIDVSAREQGRKTWPAVAAHQLARQIVRHFRADRSLHRHGGRDRGPQRSDRAVLERRPAPPQLQYRRHGTPRSRTDRVRHHGDDHELGRPHRLRHQSRRPRRAAGRRDRRDRNPEHRQDVAESLRSAEEKMGTRNLHGRGFRPIPMPSSGTARRAVHCRRKGT